MTSALYFSAFHAIDEKYVSRRTRRAIFGGGREGDGSGKEVYSVRILQAMLEMTQKEIVVEMRSSTVSYIVDQNAKHLESFDDMSGSYWEKRRLSASFNELMSTYKILRILSPESWSTGSSTRCRNIHNYSKEST
jgi:hypothetical protein